MIGLALSLQLQAAPGDKGKGKGAENSAAGLTGEEKAERKADREEQKAERKADKVKTRRPRNWTGKGRTNRADPSDPTEALVALERHSESLLDEVLAPIDRSEFVREVDYYGDLHKEE